jgi:predicted FMN-binding regulatory protein PaiB
MEQVPTWLMDAVAAAGMTAYAEDTENIVNKTSCGRDDLGLQADPPGAFH